MRQKLANVLRDCARFLEKPSSNGAPDAVMEEQPEQLTESTRATVDDAHEVDPRSLSAVWQRIVNSEQNRLLWLWSRPWVIGIVLILVTSIGLVIGCFEKPLNDLWRSFISCTDKFWSSLTNYPIALTWVGIALLILLSVFFLLQLLHFVGMFIAWVLGCIIKYSKYLVVGGILLFVVLWFADNRDAWVVLPFDEGELGTDTLKGEEVAIQLIEELNGLGAGNPKSALTMGELREPNSTTGSILASSNISAEECETVMEGPGEFIRLRSIPLPQVLAGSRSNGVDLGNLSVGSIDISLQFFAQIILRTLPTGYREFNGQFHEQNDHLEISVSSQNPNYSWRVTGPTDTYPEMMEYLALRIALDLSPDLLPSSELGLLTDRNVAFALGSQAFRRQRYQRALAFLELADQFAPLDSEVDTLLGLTHYHLALEKKPDDNGRFFEDAVRALKAAAREDPKGDTSLVHAYLGCALHKIGRTDEAMDHLAKVNLFLSRMELRDFRTRVETLKELPLLGPGWHLSGAAEDVIFVDKAGVILGAAGKPLNERLVLKGQNPRQIALYGESKLLYVTSDGSVLDYTYVTTDAGPPFRSLVPGRAVDGVRQVGISAGRFDRMNLFLLNRFGQVFWCEPDASISGTSACPPKKSLFTNTINIRQIVPYGDRLYMLADNGIVSYTAVDFEGKVADPRPLATPALVQEIALASDGTVYLLHDIGDVWRYQEDQQGVGDLKQIDPGLGTVHIFPVDNHLYLLKNDGRLWRVSNAVDPDPVDDFIEIDISILSSEDATIPKKPNIQEILVLPGQDEDDADPFNVYVLTGQGRLLRGIDTFGTQITFTPLDIPGLLETANSQ